MWNSHFEVLTGYPRTTNSIEAWHRSFNATIGCCHPTIWKFIQALKLEQGIVEFKQVKFQVGEKPTKRRNCKYQEESIRNLVRDYFNRPSMDFLRGIAHHIGLDLD